MKVDFAYPKPVLFPFEAMTCSFVGGVDDRSVCTKCDVIVAVVVVVVRSDQHLAKYQQKLSQTRRKKVTDRKDRRS